MTGLRTSARTKALKKFVYYACPNLRHKSIYKILKSKIFSIFVFDKYIY